MDGASLSVSVGTGVWGSPGCLASCVRDVVRWVPEWVNGVVRLTNCSNNCVWG